LTKRNPLKLFLKACGKNAASLAKRQLKQTDLKNAADAGDITTVQQLNWASTKFKVKGTYSSV
jgi:hypothetical protein